MRDEFVICGQLAYRFYFGLPSFVQLVFERVKVGLAPHLPAVGLVQKFAHEDYLVGVVAGLPTELVLGVKVNQGAALNLLTQRLLVSVSLVEERRIKHQL